jgi:hypothetical protein
MGKKLCIELTEPKPLEKSPEPPKEAEKAPVEKKEQVPVRVVVQKPVPVAIIKKNEQLKKQPVDRKSVERNKSKSLDRPKDKPYQNVKK